jgi:hypothetical protein
VDVTLRLEGVDTLVVEIGKAVPPVCQTRRFEELTFRDTRSEDEVRPNELWLMLAGILKHAAASDGAGRQSFQLSLENNRFADAERTSERQLLKEVTAKLRELLGMKDEAAPPFKSRKGGSRQHAYEIMFRVEVPRGDTTPRRLWTPGCRVLKKSDRQHGRRSLRIPRDRGAI